jgi:hypothetical protein
MTRAAGSPSPELVHNFAALIQAHPHAAPLAERLEADRVEVMDQLRSAFKLAGLVPGLLGAQPSTSLPPQIGRRPEAKTYADRRQRRRRLDPIKAAAPAPGTARVQVMVDAGCNSRPRGLTTPLRLRRHLAFVLD